MLALADSVACSLTFGKKIMPSSKTTLYLILAAMAVVATSTILLPEVTGYGTVLYQYVVLGAWQVVAMTSSGTFADQHHSALWAVALILNVLLFLTPVVVVGAIALNRWPRTFRVCLILWTVFYLCALFFLFPATDGP